MKLSYYSPDSCSESRRKPTESREIKYRHFLYIYIFCIKSGDPSPNEGYEADDEADEEVGYEGDDEVDDKGPRSFGNHRP